MALVEMPSAEFCCPCSGFLGWKQIRLGGRKLSKSYSDLRLLGRNHSRGWAWDDTNDRFSSKTVDTKKPPPKGTPIDKLPVEILGKESLFSELSHKLRLHDVVEIISYLAVDVPPNGYTPRNVDLFSCLLTSRILHSATLSVLYRNITIPHSIIFSKLLRHLVEYPALGTIVRRLDFSQFTSVGLGRTQQMNWEIQNLTAKTLLQCLNLVPNLRECLLQEHVENDISAAVVQKVFAGLPNLGAIDFCGCSSQIFSAGFFEALSKSPGLPVVLPRLNRVSLHECSSLTAASFEFLLPRLVNLTHLDVAHTQINAAALFAIPESARLTHLNLSRCSRLTGAQVVEFLTTHPAVSESLVYLNLLMDPSRYRLLDRQHIRDLLPRLPESLRSLNLGGAKITSEHVPFLIPLTKHLEELGLSGADLSILDLNSFFPPEPMTEEAAPPPPRSALHYLDLTMMPSLSLSALFNQKCCLLASLQSLPLEVLELSDKLINTLRDHTKLGKSKTGWTVRECGRRGWYVREPEHAFSGTDSGASDDGCRWWKMGSRWWGMRKVPVASGDVGGLYGHYMFKK